MKRTWVKLYVEQCLKGSMIEELTPAQRWMWIGLLLMAGDSPIEGCIYRRKNADGRPVGYSLVTIAEIIDVDVKELEIGLQRMQKNGKISIDENGAIEILNWRKYQSEYERQKPYRDKSNKSYKKNCNQSDKTELDIDIDIEEEESQKNKFSDAHLALSKLLEEKIKERLPRHKFKGDHYLDEWANEARLMEENKEASPDEIRKLIEWVFKDSFWSTKILSMGKLRERFGRLWEEMNSPGKREETAEEFTRRTLEALYQGDPLAEEKIKRELEKMRKKKVETPGGQE